MNRIIPSVNNGRQQNVLNLIKSEDLPLLKLLLKQVEYRDDNRGCYNYDSKTSRRCQARCTGSGRRVALGAKESEWSWRSASLKWEPPGRMDSAMSVLATWMRRLSSMVQRPASKRSWAVGVRARPLSGLSGPRFEWGARRGQAVPILCLNRNWHLLVGFWFSTPKVRPDPVG